MVKVLGIHHIAIAVKNLDEAIKKFSAILGIEPEVEEVPEEKVRIAMFRVGDTFIELLEGTSPDSPISKFIEKRGEGIHHIALRVDNVEEFIKYLKSLNIRVIYEEPRVVSKGKRKITFTHPKDVYGVMLEYVEVLGE